MIANLSWKNIAVLYKSAVSHSLDFGITEFIDKGFYLSTIKWTPYIVCIPLCTFCLHPRSCIKLDYKIALNKAIMQ